MKGNPMYNAVDQFAELNKANVAQATKLAALALENAEKLVRLNLTAAKAALAQGVEGPEGCSRRLGCRGQRVQVDDRGFHRGVRPVPEGDQASREPRRCERARRCGERDEGCPEGPQGCVMT